MDFPRGSTQDFLDLIATTVANRRAKPARNQSAVLVNADWAQFSQSVAAELPGPDWHLSPGYCLDGGKQADTDREFLYFNLHGFTGEASWKGFDSVRGQFVTAVTPDAFDRQHVSGSVVFAENCYGAETSGRTPSNSCALRLVREGAQFVGATGLAYGSHLAPGFFLDDADALAQSFWNHLAHDKEDIGNALKDAKSDYHNNGVPESNPFKQKTLLQFVLLGDPGWS